VQYCIPGDPLDGVYFSIAERAIKDSVHLQIVAAEEDLAVNGGGWTVVGPAVTFKAEALEEGGKVGFSNIGEALVAIPFRKSDLTDDARDFHINVICKVDEIQGVSNGENNDPYFLAKSPSLVKIDRDKQLLYFKNIFFGTYQAVIPSDIQEPTTRHFTYKAFGGISMGGIGSALVGFRNPDKFDILGPMGGISDMLSFVAMIKRDHLGGFCSYEEIESHAGTPEDLNTFVQDIDAQCGYCGPQQNPEDWSNPVNKCYMVEPREIYARDEHPQGYNHWYYDNQGGNFNRTSYTKMFRDLSYTFGNPTSYNPEAPYLAAGLSPEKIQTYLDSVYFHQNTKGNRDSNENGCDNLAQLMAEDPITSFYDREYNPEAKYPMIIFCDGTSQENGDYNPEDSDARKYRLDFALAVDFNGNGIRDYGEPVIRQFWEHFDDCGEDGLCNPDEPNYNAETNPDPNGDDYNPYVNALGTEGDSIRQENEHYDDFGIDGVECPAVDKSRISEVCPWDFGEGNGQFDLNPNVGRFFASDPHQNVLKMSVADLKRLNVWLDGGIRDIFNFVIMADNIAGVLDSKLASEGLETKVYNDFQSIQYPNPFSISTYRFTFVNYGQLGHNVHVRYGDYDATDDLIRGGDGRHVGLNAQVLARMESFLMFASYHWPNGDYRPVSKWSLGELFRSERYDSAVLKREARYAVAFPPGYFENNTINPDGTHNCVDRYPVMLLGHGYGMDPNGMAPTFAPMFGFMADGTMQKMIGVFPDGECSTPDVCRSDCRDSCNTAEDKEACAAECQVERDCDNYREECMRGTFYQNHVATRSNPKGTPDENGWIDGQGEDYVFELIDLVDSLYCTKSAEDVQVDGATLDGLY